MNYNKIPVYVLTAILLGTAPAALAQGTQNRSELRKANNHYKNNEYALAIEQYMRAAGSSELDLENTQRIADSYRQLQRTQEAENWYAKVVAMPEREPINLFYYGEMLRSNGKYEEAKAQYEKWATEQPEMAARAKQLSASADFAMEAANKRPVATIEAIAPLNADNFADFSPKPFNGGIIFSSDRSMGADAKIYSLTGRPFIQLYTAQQDGQGNWGSPVVMQSLSTSGSHNATASAANDGQVVYFTRSRDLAVASDVNADPTSWAKPAGGKGTSNNLEIFSAEKSGDSWTNVTPFAYNKVEEYSVGHPAVSADGTVMYFVSDMPGGQGDTDIYYTTRQGDGSWGQPVNAGTSINTVGRESFPSVDETGKLYFASNGHAGMGGLDIFSAEGSVGAWTEVKNMGQPVNSSKNDYGIMFLERDKKGLLSSNRNSTNGTDDIYGFELLDRVVVVAVDVVDDNGVALKDVKIDMRQKGKDTPMAVAVDSTGRFFIEGHVGDEYSLRGTKEGYLNQSLQVVIPETAGDTLSLSMQFDSNVEEMPKVIRNVYYDLDKWNIREDAAVELDKLVNLLKENPEIRVEIGAHTDSQYLRKYNMTLSYKRAGAVVDYLVSRGIDKSRLQSKGYGETRLVNRCKDKVKCSPEEHQANRRTEFKIIKK